MSIIDRLRDRLIDDWRQAWRLWSVRLAALAGAIAAAIVGSPQLLLGLIAHAPDRWRPLAAAAAGVIVFLVPAITRVIRQGGKDG